MRMLSLLPNISTESSPPISWSMRSHVASDDSALISRGNPLAPAPCQVARQSNAEILLNTIHVYYRNYIRDRYIRHLLTPTWPSLTERTHWTWRQVGDRESRSEPTTRQWIGRRNDYGCRRVIARTGPASVGISCERTNPVPPAGRSIRAIELPDQISVTRSYSSSSAAASSGSKATTSESAYVET